MGPIVVHDQWRVIGKPLVLVNVGPQYFVLKTLRYDLIVDPPPDILIPCPATIRPPGVLVRLLIQRPEGVDVPVFTENLVHPCTLFGQESRVLAIAPPVLQVNFLVSDIPIATDDRLRPTAL